MAKGRKRTRSQVTARRNAIIDNAPPAPANSPDPVFRLTKRPKSFAPPGAWGNLVTVGAPSKKVHKSKCILLRSSTILVHF